MMVSGKRSWGRNRDSALNVMIPRRETMRTSRILAVLLLLCFTFAGTSMLWAQPVDVPVRLGNERFTLRYDSNTRAFDGIRNEAGQIQPTRQGPVWNLRIMEHGQPPQRIISVPDGTIITSGDGTCVWYFIGGTWIQFCN